MQPQNRSILGLTLVISILLYLSFTPWKLTEVSQHTLILFLITIFPFAIAIFLIKNKRRAFKIALVFFMIGFLFLMRGFYLVNQFSIMDYILNNNDITIIDEIGENQIRITHGHALSYIMIESVVIYTILNILGIVIGMKVDEKA